MSEDQATRRLSALRAVRVAPAAISMLRSGEVTMSALAELRELLELALDPPEVVLAEARGRSVREVRRFVAERLGIAGSEDRIRERGEDEVKESGRRQGSFPRAGGAFEIRFTAGPGFVEKLERARALLSHAVPDGDFEEVIGRGLDLLIDAVERRRTGKLVRGRTGRRAEPAPEGDAMSRVERRGVEPAPEGDATSRVEDRQAEPAPEGDATSRVEGRGGEPASDGDAMSRVEVRRPKRRSLPRAVVREVWTRDGGRCTYVCPRSGRRCLEAMHVEIDHAVPRALGGPDTAANLRLRCRSHNRLVAETELGPAFVGAKIRGGGAKVRGGGVGTRAGPCGG
jgi:hypothetical protein